MKIIHIKLDDALHSRLRVYALTQGITMQDLIPELITGELTGMSKTQEKAVLHPKPEDAPNNAFQGRQANEVIVDETKLFEAVKIKFCKHGYAPALCKNATCRRSA